MVIWNRRWMMHKGLHTFAAERTAEGWEVFNRFNDDETSRRYARLDDILLNGRGAGAFLVIYQVFRKEDLS